MKEFFSCSFLWENVQIRYRSIFKIYQFFILYNFGNLIEKQFVDKCKMCTTNSYILKLFVKDRARQYQDTTEVNFLLVILWIYCVHLCCVERFFVAKFVFLEAILLFGKRNHYANKYFLLTDIKLKCQRIQYQWYCHFKVKVIKLKHYKMY